MLKELIEHGKNIREEMKVTLSEIKKNLQGTKSGEEESENQAHNLEHKEGKSIQLELQAEKEFKKMRIGLWTSGTTPNTTTSEP